MQCKYLPSKIKGNTEVKILRIRGGMKEPKKILTAGIDSIRSPRVGFIFLIVEILNKAEMAVTGADHVRQTTTVMDQIMASRMILSRPRIEMALQSTSLGSQAILVRHAKGSGLIAIWDAII